MKVIIFSLILLITSTLIDCRVFNYAKHSKFVPIKLDNQRKHEFLRKFENYVFVHDSSVETTGLSVFKAEDKIDMIVTGRFRKRVSKAWQSCFWHANWAKFQCIKFTEVEDNSKCDTKKHYNAESILDINAPFRPKDEHAIVLGGRFSTHSRDELLVETAAGFEVWSLKSDSSTWEKLTFDTAPLQEFRDSMTEHDIMFAAHFIKGSSSQYDIIVANRHTGSITLFENSRGSSKFHAKEVDSNVPTPLVENADAPQISHEPEFAKSVDVGKVRDSSSRSQVVFLRTDPLKIQVVRYSSSEARKLETTREDVDLNDQLMFAGADKIWTMRLGETAGWGKFQILLGSDDDIMYTVPSQDGSQGLEASKQIYFGWKRKRIVMTEDPDDDGLINFVELGGKLDAPIHLHCPSPFVKDIFVYVAEMDDADLKLTDTAKATIKESFSTMGFQIHMEYKTIPKVENIGSSGENWDNQAVINAKIGTYKTTHLPEEYRGIFRFGLVANQIKNSDQSGYGQGAGDGTGSTYFVMSLGQQAWRDQHAATAGRRDGDQAGTFLHELSHCIGQRHGNFDGRHKKPNHLSIMSYTYQRWGVPVKNDDGTFTSVYTLQRLGCNALDENHLDETVGVVCPQVDATDPYMAEKNLKWVAKDTFEASWPSYLINEPADWDRDGSAVSTDVQKITRQGGATRRVLGATTNEYDNLKIKNAEIGHLGIEVNNGIVSYDYTGRTSLLEIGTTSTPPPVENSPSLDSSPSSDSSRKEPTLAELTPPTEWTSKFKKLETNFTPENSFKNLMKGVVSSFGGKVSESFVDQYFQLQAEKGDYAHDKPNFEKEEEHMPANSFVEDVSNQAMLRLNK